MKLISAKQIINEETFVPTLELTVQVPYVLLEGSKTELQVGMEFIGVLKEAIIVAAEVTKQKASNQYNRNR